MIVGIGQARFGCRLMPEIRVLVRNNAASAAGSTDIRTSGSGRTSWLRGSRCRRSAAHRAAACSRTGCRCESPVSSAGRMIEARSGGRRGRHGLPTGLAKASSKFVGAVDRFLRAAAPLAAHVAVLGHLGVQRGFLRRDVAVVSPADNHMLQADPIRSSCLRPFSASKSLHAKPSRFRKVAGSRQADAPQHCHPGHAGAARHQTAGGLNASPRWRGRGRCRRPCRRSFPRMVPWRPARWRHPVRPPSPLSGSWWRGRLPVRRRRPG